MSEVTVRNDEEIVARLADIIQSVYENLSDTGEYNKGFLVRAYHELVKDYTDELLNADKNLEPRSVEEITKDMEEYYWVLYKASPEYAREIYDSIGEDLVQEEWPSGIVSRVINEAVKGFDGTLKTKEELKAMISRMAAQQEQEERTKQYLKQKEEAKKAELLKELSSRDYTKDIKNFLIEHNCKSITPNELVDRYWKLYGSDKSDEYYGSKMYAAYKNLGTEDMMKSLQDCVRSLQKSQTVLSVVNRYLDKVEPKRDKDSYYIDKLVSELPRTMNVQTDDKYYKAYLSICHAEDEASKGKKELTAEQIREDDQISEAILAKLAAEIEDNEPYNVAYREAGKSGLEVISNKLGRVMAMPTKVVDTINKGVDLGQREALGDELYELKQKRKELRRRAAEEKRKREEEEDLLEQLRQERAKYQRELDNYNNRDRTPFAERLNREIERDRYYRDYDYNYKNRELDSRKSDSYDSGSTSKNSGETGLASIRLDNKMMCIIVHIVIAMVLLFATSLFQVDTTLIVIGLLVGCFGWCSKNTKAVLIGYGIAVLGLLYLMM